MSDIPKAIILNIDDDEANRYVTTRMLWQAGFQVKEAATGTEALKMAEEKPDLIVLDVLPAGYKWIEVC